MLGICGEASGKRIGSVPAHGPGVIIIASLAFIVLSVTLFPFQLPPKISDALRPRVPLSMGPWLVPSTLFRWFHERELPRNIPPYGYQAALNLWDRTSTFPLFCNGSDVGTCRALTRQAVGLSTDVAYGIPAVSHSRIECNTIRGLLSGPPKQPISLSVPAPAFYTENGDAYYIILQTSH